MSFLIISLNHWNWKLHLLFASLSKSLTTWPHLGSISKFHYTYDSTYVSTQRKSFCILWYNELRFVEKSAKIVLSKLIFYVKNRRNFFIFFFIDEYLFRRPFFVKKKNFFEPIHFLKSCPIFDELALPVFTKYNGFNTMVSFEYADFWPKSCFYGPTIFEIPQPNWH